MIITGIDVFKYATKVLSKLFSPQEIKEGAVEPTGAGRYPALDQARIAILQSFKLIFI
jgi:hypothetical protein